MEKNDQVILEVDLSLNILIWGGSSWTFDYVLRIPIKIYSGIMFSAKKKKMEKDKIFCAQICKKHIY